MGSADLNIRQGRNGFLEAWGSVGDGEWVGNSPQMVNFASVLLLPILSSLLTTTRREHKAVGMKLGRSPVEWTLSRRGGGQHQGRERNGD